jgi:hypothetical protein
MGINSKESLLVALDDVSAIVIRVVFWLLRHYRQIRNLHHFCHGPGFTLAITALCRDTLGVVEPHKGSLVIVDRVA